MTTLHMDVNNDDERKENILDEPANTGEATSANDITQQELELLDKAGVNETKEDDDEILSAAQLDDEDEDGEKLNESIDLTGSDLDVPGSETDDENEAIGEEDEENNEYSQRDQDDESEADVNN